MYHANLLGRLAAKSLDVTKIIWIISRTIDVGATRKILDESCCIFIKYDADDLISAIKHLLNEPELIKELGLNARNKALNEHNISIYSDYFIQI